MFDEDFDLNSMPNQEIVRKINEMRLQIEQYNQSQQSVCEEQKVLISQESEEARPVPCRSPR